MKRLIFLLALVLAGSAMFAQTIDTPNVTVNLTGETATVTLKAVSSTRAINELCEQGVQSKTNSVLVPGVWEVAYDATGYTPKFNGTALDGSPFKAKADAVKALKLKMKAHYATNGTLAMK